MTESNADGIWCAIGATEYEKNGELPTAPESGEVSVTLDDDTLNEEGIFNASHIEEEEVYVVEMNGVPYTSIYDALDVLQPHETATIKVLNDFVITHDQRMFSNYSIVINAEYVTLDLNGMDMFMDSASWAVDMYVILRDNCNL